MLEAAGNLVVSAMDYVLGWVLYLPRDLMLLVVAVLTSAILTFVRLFCTDQDWLKRAAADRKRLRRLIRQARRGRDKPARKRYKATLTLIKLKSLRFEGKPLLWAIVPVALLATWCFSRLAYQPPRPGQQFELRAYLPNSAIGRLVHLVPQEGLQVEGGWIQSVRKDRPMPVEGMWDAFNARTRALFGMEAPLEGVAVWRIRADTREGGYVLKLHCGGRTHEKKLLVGSRRYAPAVAAYEQGPVQFVELGMRPVKLFGVVGGIDVLYMPPWLVAYLLIAIPFVTVLKRLFRVY
jgi:uncharacterized membrane protein (DUF106 family)